MNSQPAIIPEVTMEIKSEVMPEVIPKSEEIKEEPPVIISVKKKRKKSRKIQKAKDYPKFYKNGYVRFCDHVRPIVCEKSPNIDPVEITKIVAAQWFALGPDEKKPYLDEAKLDKDRFKRELKEYNRHHPEGSEALLSSTSAVAAQKNSKAKSDQTKTETLTSTTAPSLSTASGENHQAEATKQSKEDDVPKCFVGVNCELPIFTENFLVHNKAIESELKQLRKNNIEIEQQNSVLMKHVENMQNGVQKVESEIVSTKQRNVQLEIYLTKLKCVLASGLHSLTLPSLKSGASVENIEKYMQELSSPATSSASPAIVNKAGDIIRKMDLKFAN